MVIEGVDTTGRHKTHNLQWKWGRIQCSSFSSNAKCLSHTQTEHAAWIPDASYNLWQFSRWQWSRWLSWKVHVKGESAHQFILVFPMCQMQTQRLSPWKVIGVIVNIVHCFFFVVLSADFRTLKTIFQQQGQTVVMSPAKRPHTHKKCVPSITMFLRFSSHPVCPIVFTAHVMLGQQWGGTDMCKLDECMKFLDLLVSSWHKASESVRVCSSPWAKQIPASFRGCLT